MPWDIEAPWGEVDEYGGDATSGYYPLMVTDWPFKGQSVTMRG